MSYKHYDKHNEYKMFLNVKLLWSTPTSFTHLSETSYGPRFPAQHRPLYPSPYPNSVIVYLLGFCPVQTSVKLPWKLIETRRTNWQPSSRPRNCVEHAQGMETGWRNSQKSSECVFSLHS